MGNQTHRGWRRLLNAAGYSWAGLKAAWRNEEAFRQEGCYAPRWFPVALWLGDNAVEQALLIGSLLLVMMVRCSIPRSKPLSIALVLNVMKCRAAPRVSVQPQYLSPYLMPRWYG